MILVTGGAGFIGSNFVEAWLAERNEPVLTVDKLTYAGNLGNLATVIADSHHRFVRADIADRAAMDQLLAQYCPRAIINFAAESHVDRSIAGADAFLQTNVLGTHTLLEATRCYYDGLAQSARQQFRFHHISTDEVYGTLAEGEAGFSENSPYRPNNPYAASKAAADHFIRAWHKTYGLPTIITHSCNNFGPRQHPEKLIPRIIECALRGETLPIYGDGLHRREWLYVKDNCAAIRAVLEAGTVGETYVIGGSKEIANLDLVQLLCTHLDSMVPRANSYADQIAFVRDRAGHDRRYALDDTRISRELGWQPATSFSDGLRETIAWYIANPRALNSC